MRSSVAAIPEDRARRAAVKARMGNPALVIPEAMKALQALAAVVLAGDLGDVAFADQRAEHAGEALFGDAEDGQQLADLQTGASGRNGHGRWRSASGVRFSRGPCISV